MAPAPGDQKRARELRMKYDEISIPVSAKCSMCGEQMPQSAPRIPNSYLRLRAPRLPMTKTGCSEPFFVRL